MQGVNVQKVSLLLLNMFNSSEGTEDTLWDGIFIPEYLVAKLLPIDYKDPLKYKAMCMEVFADLESVLNQQGLTVEFEEKTYDGKTKFHACVKQK